MTANYFIPKLDLREYLEDRGRLSGSVLSWVANEPERFGAWLEGKTTDRATAATGRGSYVHARLLEPETVSRSFAFYPNRNEATEEETEEAVGPRGGKKTVKTGRLVPQDASPEGRYKSLLKTSAHGREQHRAFLEGAKGRTIVYPEDQPLCEAMIRAVWRHPKAAELLRPEGLGPEVTGHFTCPETGEPMRIRPDAVRIDERVWVEVKTVQPRGDERLDTTSSKAIGRWAGEGWARKSALLHDGCRAITGENFTGFWIIIEATADDPRVSVVRDEAGSSMHELGILGCESWGIPGYLDLIRAAQQMRRSGDFRHECVRDVVPRWLLPDGLVTSMQFEQNAAGGVQLTGARQVANG